MTRFMTSSVSLILLIAAVTACLPLPAPPVSTPVPAGPVPTRPPASTRVPTQTAVNATAGSRTASIAELSNIVQSREATDVNWGEATLGQTLPIGGEVKTLVEANARLDFSEGAIVRIGAETYFTITDLSGTNLDPVTRLTLAAGELWVILATALNGGSFEVETPTGSASVQGSYLSVAYDPASDSVTVSCLEGRCALRNALGQIDLVAGQETSILQRGQPPSLPRPMSPERLERWRQFVREAQQLIQPMRQQLEPLWRDPAFIATAEALSTRMASVAPQPGAIRTQVASTLEPAPVAPPVLTTPLPTLPPLPGGLRP